MKESVSRASVTTKKSTAVAGDVTGETMHAHDTAPSVRTEMSLQSMVPLEVRSYITFASIRSQYNDRCKLYLIIHHRISPTKYHCQLGGTKQCFQMGNKSWSDTSESLA